MAQHKATSLDQIHFENVSFYVENLDPVLTHVDLELPMDQTVIVRSTNPTHAVHVLEILAGLKNPISGRIRWSDAGSYEDEPYAFNLHEVMGCYFESYRPAPHLTVRELLMETQAAPDVINEAIEHFELGGVLKTKFSQLRYEQQKIVMLVRPTLKMPQMLVLEDPALGLSESVFLSFLDWVQLWQRQGHLRHVFMTNHHPTAARHLEACELHIEDGLIYIDDESGAKKIVHF